MNMVDWRSVAAGMDDTTAALDSCSLKRRRRVSSPSVREEKREHRTKTRTFASAANVGEVGDEGVESLEDLELYFDILRNAVVQCLDDGQDLREGDWAQGDVTGTR
jgi:hypothetical protein